MKPQIISHTSGTYGITAEQAGGCLLDVAVSELWQPEWWHCHKHGTSADRSCWLVKGRQWTGTASLTAAGTITASDGLAEWLAEVAGAANSEAAIEVLTTELAHLAEVPMVIHRQGS